MRYGRIIDLEKCYGCNACTIICKQRHATPPKVMWAKVYESEVGKARAFKPSSCMHCKNAPCVSVCPTGASYKRADGVVLIDQTKCIRCSRCISACPYGERFLYNTKDGETYFPGKETTAYESFYEGAYESGEVGIVTKCVMCYDLLEKGQKPACDTVCPTGARVFGDLDDANSAASKLISNNNGYQDKPEAGTDPSVYYSK